VEGESFAGSKEIQEVVSTLNGISNANRPSSSFTHAKIRAFFVMM